VLSFCLIQTLVQHQNWVLVLVLLVHQMQVQEVV
jgi:hypothetical protein